MLYSFVDSIGQTISISAGPIRSNIFTYYTPSSHTILDRWYKNAFETANNKSYTGWKGSLKIDYIIKDGFFLSSSVEFSQKGSKGEYSNQVSGGMLTNEIKSEFQFISLNTLIHPKINITNNTIVYYTLGPEVNLMINRKLTKNPIIDQLKLESQFNKLLVGLLCGFGIKHNLKKLQLGIDLGYDYSIGYLLNHTMVTDSFYEPDHTSNFKMRLNNFYSTVPVGYRL